MADKRRRSRVGAKAAYNVRQDQRSDPKPKSPIARKLGRPSNRKRANMKKTPLRFFGYRCPRCGDETWLADIPERYIYCALCGGDDGDLVLTKIITARGGTVQYSYLDAEWKWLER